MWDMGFFDNESFSGHLWFSLILWGYWEGDECCVSCNAIHRKPAPLLLYLQPREQCLKTGKEDEMLMAPLQPSNMAKCNPKFSSRRCLSTCASRLIILDFVCIKATEIQCPRTSIVQTEDPCFASVFPTHFLFIRCSLEAAVSPFMEKPNQCYSRCWGHLWHHLGISVWLDASEVLLSEEINHRLALAVPVLGDTSHKVALHLWSFLWDHTDS